MTSKHTTKVKWFFLDFGGFTNNWINNIDFKHKSILLKDKYQYMTINYNVITDIKYDCCLEQIHTYNENTTLLQEDIESFYYNYFGELILKDVHDKVCNEPTIDISHLDVNQILTTTLPIGAFDTTRCKYICILNFNPFLSRCLKILTTDKHVKQNTAMYIIAIDKGITNNYSHSNKHNGYQVNLMSAFWNNLEKRPELIGQKYKIGKITFTLGNLIGAIMPRFKNLYVIFESIGSVLDKQSHKFKNEFRSIKDKTKRAKKLNSIKNNFNMILKNTTLQSLKDSEDINFIDLSKSLYGLSLNNDKTKMNNIKLKYMNYPGKITTVKSSLSKERDTEIHTICKYFTGSKHCYYSGYKDVIKDFDKFELEQSNARLKLIEPLDGMDDVDIMADEMDTSLTL